MSNFYKSIKDKIGLKLLDIHEWMQERPMIVSFILHSSCILFSFLLIFCGDNIPKPFTLTEYDKEGHLRLTVVGFVISLACLLWTFLIQAAERYYHYKKGSSTDAEVANYIRERVDSRISKVCDNKYNTLISLISDIRLGKENPIYIISKPCEQLKNITNEMSSCLRELLVHDGYVINEDEMYVSIFYKFDIKDEWEQTQSPFPEMGLPVDEVTNNINSTFSHTLLSKNGIVFINNKQEGFVRNQYIPDKDDRYDDSGNLKGSILCYRIICRKNGTEHIKAVLSISTYDKRIEPSNVLEKRKNVQDNIKNYIIKEFEKRIKIELCLLYLSELYDGSKIEEDKLVFY